MQGAAWVNSRRQRKVREQLTETLAPGQGHVRAELRLTEGVSRAL